VSLRHLEAIDGRAGRVRFAVTDRREGVSTPPYAGLNLGGHVGDAEADVTSNRAALAVNMGLPVDRLIFMNQVHGDTVARVEGPWPGPAAAADALVTTTAGLALVVLVADCVPVLLADPDAGVVGVAHAGRPGLAAGVVLRLVEAMRDLGARSIVGRLGPSVCRRCYEVPAALRDEVAAVSPVAASVDRHGMPALDIAAGVLAQLAPLCAAIDQLPGCTRETADLYSYRRDGVTGRFAGLATLSAPGDVDPAGPDA
jgi:polyphenol oxidase